MHKMKLIQAHTLAHLHTRIAKYAHKDVHKIYSPFYFFLFSPFLPLTQIGPPTHTHLFWASLI